AGGGRAGGGGEYAASWIVRPAAVRERRGGNGRERSAGNGAPTTDRRGSSLMVEPLFLGDYRPHGGRRRDDGRPAPPRGASPGGCGSRPTLGVPGDEIGSPARRRQSRPTSARATADLTSDRRPHLRLPTSPPAADLTSDRRTRRRTPQARAACERSGANPAWWRNGPAGAPRGAARRDVDRGGPMTAATERPAPDAGHKPGSPTDLHKPSWGFALKGAVREFMDDQCTGLAAALTYYAVLASAPALLALVSILGLVGDGEKAVDSVLQSVEGVVPATTLDMIEPLVENGANTD